MKTRSIICLTLLAVSMLVRAGTVEYSYSFNKPVVKNNNGFQTFSFENSLLTALPGQPVLPYCKVSLMLPPGESASGIEILFENEVTLTGSYRIYPQQEVRPVGTVNPGALLRDQSVYTRNTSYPENPKGKLITSFLNGHAFALSSFTPLRYNPVTGWVSYYASVRVVVHSAPDTKAVQALSNLSPDASAALKLADNKEQESSYQAFRKPATDNNYELLIICTAAFSGSFSSLQAAYLTEGLRSQVATRENIVSTMTGADDQEKIRNYIIQEYQQHGIQHVLLAGDAELIPYRGLYCYVISGSGYEDYGIPSDLYYSALDGNWNTNGNSKWGEPGEDDLLPEVSVGRLPFSTNDELSHMLNKTLSYQFTPVAGEFRSPLLAGEYLYPAPYLTYGSYYMRLLVGTRSDNGYTTTGIPPSYTIDSMYDEQGTWYKQDLMNHLNQGRPMLNHTGHANQTYVMRLVNSDITNSNFSGLNGINHNFTVIYTHGCDCGAFDYDDCIAEKMVGIDNFAAAFIGNSRYGWFNEGTSEGPSEHLHREFMDALYSDKLNRIGRAHMESKIASAYWVTAPGQWEPGALRWVFYDCNVLGDPAMAEFTDNPIEIQTSFPATIPAGTSSIAVQVSSSGSPAANLNCVLIENGVLLGKAVTDISGNASVSLNPAISDPSQAQLVVSGYNCTPASYNLLPKTYSWNATSGTWNSASNWTPARTKPAVNDILVFDGNIQPTAVVTPDYISTQHLAKLRIINHATVTLSNAAVTKSLSLGAAGLASPALEISAGSSLTVTAANPVIMNILSGFTATIAGNLTFQQAAHRLNATDANAITFSSGSMFTAGSGFTGNAFGILTPVSVLFENGSSYLQQAGDSPFGLAAPGSVVSFQPGSLFKFTAASGSPDLCGRNYGNLEINSASSDLASLTGSGNLNLQDFTLTAGNCGLNFSGTHSIKGNLTLAAGTSLNISPAAPSILNFNGTAAQHISGNGSLSCGANSTINTANSAGVILENAVTMNNLSISSGTFTLASGASLITNGTVSGNAVVEREIANDNSWHFLSSPVTSQTILPVFAPADLNTTFDFYGWSPGQDLATGQPWINLRIESGLNTDFDPLHPSAPEFKTASGYLVAYSPGYTNPGHNGTLRTFAGNLNTGTIPLHLLDAANPWNLAGNPYPSSIDFDAFSTAAGSVLAAPAYWTVLSDGSFGSYLSGSGGVNGASRFIAPMQGFFLEASHTADVSLSNSMRSHSSQSWLKSSEDLPDQLRLRVTNSSNSVSDEVLIHRSASFAGNSGAPKLLGMSSGSVNLFTVKSGRNFCIDQLNDSTQQLTIGLIPPASGDYSLSATLNSFSAGNQLILEDLKTGKRQDLQKNPAYSFTASTGDNVNRFVLHLNQTYGVPGEITWKGIQAYVVGKMLYIRQTDLHSGIISLYNASGQQLISESLEAVKSQTLSLQKLDAGIYLVKISSGRALFREKIVVR